MKRYFLSKIKSQKYFLALGDVILLILSYIIAYYLNFIFISSRYPSFTYIFDRVFPLIIPISFIYIFIFYLADLYEIPKIKNYFYCLITITICVLISTLISSGILFFFTKYIIGRKVIIINLFSTTIMIFLWRYLSVKYISKKEGILKIAIIGGSQNVSSFLKDYSKIEEKGYKINNIYLTKKKEKETDLSILDDYKTNLRESINEILEESNFDILLYDSNQKEFTSQHISKIFNLKYQGKTILDFSSFLEELTGKIYLDYIDNSWIFNRGEFQGKTSKNYLRIKRLIDIMLSSILIILFLQIYFIIALFIKLESKGNIIFKQKRLGIRKHPFYCYKFRTMKTNAERETGPVWSNINDPRITRVGKLLRKIRLDELPQLWNILRGDMSFIGNRPIRKHFADKLSDIIPYYDLRFSIKPGLSGWAQVNHGYSGSQQGQYEKFQYELFYIKNMSLFLDLYTMFKTMKIIIKGKGE